MKNIKLLLAAFATVVFSGCMDHYDDPTNYVYGNPSVGEPNTTIKALKTNYKDIIASNGSQEIEEDLIISGVIVGDDESGNIYKDLYVRDSTGTLVVGINATGLYAYLPVGQKVAIDCKGLYIGGYGAMAQLGALYQGKIGRMSEYLWKDHVKPIGQPSLSYPELTPIEADEAWVKAADKTDAPFFVKLVDATFVEADGQTQYAPEDEADGGNGVNRNIKLGSTTIPFRTSTYSNFATDYMKMGSVNITGLLTQYGGSWQFTVRTERDIQ
ncbi:MAG: DUF5689 domain-containing protein [Paraprevotella sp.]|nr:DUF5689 domain-containing protein [Paraprevotella sp.]